MDILIAGVGGQGIILASRALGAAAAATGLPVRTAETIGMAQREGSVVSHVRLGVQEAGPLIPAAAA
ncbi:MAG: 2-oxoacid:acceptor oxidoreductase family protein, partial [Moorella sp. (in: Bacteria)]|nr:2-oxoacid:acceptor oxidoreductase family protein [Moorella sp. (in: firmicutes)]